jgi:hypothetical protein
MSLVRLLTAGKSLVGLRDSANRYRVTTARLLPKFDSKKNPFGTATEEKTALVEAALPPATEAGSSRAESKPETTHQPVKTSTLPARRAGWISKLIALCRTRRERSIAVSRALPRLASRPIQPELSLESVRVMRNDLSDTDLEIRTAKTVRAAAPAPAPAAAPETVSRSERARSGKPWAALAGRLFASEKH